jgi:hypothetical protein
MGSLSKRELEELEEMFLGPLPTQELEKGATVGEASPRSKTMQQMQQKIHYVEQVKAPRAGFCFECARIFYAGDPIVCARVLSNDQSVAFHESCWQVSSR